MQTEKSQSFIVIANGGSLGIENIKNILTVVISFFIDLVEALKTKNWFKIVEIVFGLMKFGNIIAIAKQAWNEFKDLGADETREVTEHFKQVFDIESDELEAKIEEAVSIIPEVYDLILESLSTWTTGVELFRRLQAIFKEKTLN